MVGLPGFMKNKPTKLPDDVDIESHGPLPTTNDAAPRKNGPFRSPPTKKTASQSDSDAWPAQWCVSP